MTELFHSNGFEVVLADDLKDLSTMQEQVRDIAHQLLGKPNTQVEHDLNYLHESFASAKEVDDFRLKLTTEIAESINFGQRIYKIFNSYLEPLVGVDVLAQKTPNLVFQPPKYPVPTELHRDAPANSPYEIIVWLPFVDCFRTKSMYLLNRKFSRIAAEHIRDNPKDRPGFDNILLDHAELMDVPFGSALVFWSGLFHGSIVNKEKESRLSLNTRYKNLFTPLGLKDPFRYFDVLKTSSLTKLGIDFELKEQLD